MAQIVFANRPAKRAQYSYRPTSSSTNTTEFTGIVAPQQTVVITSLPFEIGKFLSFENRGETNLQFDLSTDTVTLTDNIAEVAGGTTINQSMEWLFAEGTNGTLVNVLAHNPSDTETASYLVNINIE